VCIPAVRLPTSRVAGHEQSGHVFASQGSGGVACGVCRVGLALAIHYSKTVLSFTIRQPCSESLCAPPLIITFWCCAQRVLCGHVRMPIAYLLYVLLEVTLWLRFVYRGVDRWWCPHPGVQNLATAPRLECGCDDMRQQWETRWRGGDNTRSCAWPGARPPHNARGGCGLCMADHTGPFGS
jgi:hypothetical protein